MNININNKTILQVLIGIALVGAGFGIATLLQDTPEKIVVPARNITVEPYFDTYAEAIKPRGNAYSIRIKGSTSHVHGEAPIIPDALDLSDVIADLNMMAKEQALGLPHKDKLK